MNPPNRWYYALACTVYAIVFIPALLVVPVIAWAVGVMDKFDERRVAARIHG